tara:strand:- start:293 stop:733 length:441 start_codon:yes stop_codon:yes gene_type:complete
MNKMNKILAFLAFLIIGCAEKEILPCGNLTSNNGITYSNNRVFNGTCHLFVSNDSILWKTITYKRGKLSKEIAYYEDGKVDYIGHRNRDGHIHGDFTKYYKNGNLEVFGQLENGFREGDWDVYNENGDLIREIIYRKGEPVDSIIY